MKGTSKNNYLKFYNFSQNLSCDPFNNHKKNAQQQFTKKKRKTLEKSKAFTSVKSIF